MHPLVKGNNCRMIPNQTEGGYHLRHKDKELEQLTTSFMERLRIRGLSPKTIEAYGYDLVYFFRWLDLFGKHVSQLIYQDLFEYTKHQVDSGAKPRSVNRRLVVCRLFIAFLSDRDISVHPSHMTKGVSPILMRQGACRILIKIFPPRTSPHSPDRQAFRYSAGM